MALVDLLKNDTSGTSFKGKAPAKAPRVTPINPDSLIDSQLDLDGKKPVDNYVDKGPADGRY